MPRIQPARANREPQRQPQPSVTVRSGDTMSAIANRHGLSLQQLIAANPQVADPNLIRVGQALQLPGTAVAANDEPTALASGQTYTVRAGDTMSAIAARHGADLGALISVNPQVANPSRIRPGQLLNLPSGSGVDRQAANWNTGTENAGARWNNFRGLAQGRTLRRGHMGNDIRQLQDALVTLGHMTRGQANTGPGIFGALTQSAVRSFQGAHGLSRDGIVGPRTRTALGAALSQSSRPTRDQPELVAPQPAPERPSRRPDAGSNYDGSRPANGTTNSRAWIPIDAPAQSQPGARSRAQYDQVLNQFAVGANPRYTPRNGNTYCNIFVWDATRAMGAEIPHWVDQQGRAARVGAPGAWEMDANDTNRWLNRQGGNNGWRKVDAAEAQRMANDGKPAVVSWLNPNGIGHIGMIRPGTITARGAALAQAGRNNFNNRHVADGFGRLRPEYWVHE